MRKIRLKPVACLACALIVLALSGAPGAASGGKTYSWEEISPYSAAALNGYIYYLTHADGISRYDPGTEETEPVVSGQKLAGRLGILDPEGGGAPQVSQNDALLASDGQALYCVSFSRGKIFSVTENGLRQHLAFQNTKPPADEEKEIYCVWESAAAEDGNFFALFTDESNRQEIWMIDGEGGMRLLLAGAFFNGFAPYKGGVAVLRPSAEAGGYRLSRYSLQGRLIGTEADFPNAQTFGLCLDEDGENLYTISAGKLYRVRDGKAAAVREISAGPRGPKAWIGVTGGWFALARLAQVPAALEVYPLDPPAGEITLQIKGIYCNQPPDAAFSQAYPPVVVTRTEDVRFTGHDVYTAILNRDGAADIFYVRLSAEVQALMEKGYLLPLNSGALENDLDRLYPVYAAPLQWDGVIYAVADRVDIYPWAIPSSVSAAVSAAKEDWLRLMEAVGAESQEQAVSCLAYWNAGYPIPWSAEDYAAALYTQYVLENEEALDFSAPAFTRPMEALRGLVSRGIVALSDRDGEIAGEPWFYAGGGPGIPFATPFSLNGVESGHFRYIAPPRCDSLKPCSIPAEITVYVVNPYTEHREEALLFLSYCAANRDAQSAAMLYPGAEPRLYEPERLENMKSELDSLNAALKAASGEDRAEWQARIDIAQSKADSFENNPENWAIWGPSLEAYQNTLLPQAAVSLSPFLSRYEKPGSAGSIQDEMLRQMKMYLSGSMDIAQCAARMNEISWAYRRE